MQGFVRRVSNEQAMELEWGWVLTSLNDHINKDKGSKAILKQILLMKGVLINLKAILITFQFKEKYFCLIPLVWIAFFIMATVTQYSFWKITEFVLFLRLFTTQRILPTQRSNNLRLFSFWHLLLLCVRSDRI